MKIATKTRSIKSLEKTADKWFSLYIRLKDADGKGMVTCVTCGKKMHYKEADCGHFVTRNHKIHRYNERNCNVQCTFCNRFKYGEQYKHGKYIDKIHGEGTSDYLMITRNQITKRDRFDLMQIIEEYKEKIKELGKNYP